MDLDLSVCAEDFDAIPIDGRWDVSKNSGSVCFIFNYPFTGISDIRCSRYHVEQRGLRSNWRNGIMFRYIFVTGSISRSGSLESVGGRLLRLLKFFGDWLIGYSWVCKSELWLLVAEYFIYLTTQQYNSWFNHNIVY